MRGLSLRAKLQAAMQRAADEAGEGIAQATRHVIRGERFRDSRKRGKALLADHSHTSPGVRRGTAGDRSRRFGRCRRGRAGGCAPAAFTRRPGRATVLRRTDGEDIRAAFNGRCPGTGRSLVPEAPCIDLPRYDHRAVVGARTACARQQEAAKEKWNKAYRLRHVSHPIARDAVVDNALA